MQRAARDDRELAGVGDITADWLLRMAARKGFAIYASAEDRLTSMREVGLEISGTLGDLLGTTDVIVNCTPKTIALARARAKPPGGSQAIR